MNEREKWLKQHLKETHNVSEEEKSLLKLLSDKFTHENDLFGVIDTSEVLLSLDALPLLVGIIKDTDRSLSIRQQAAKTIHKIGADYVKAELIKLKTSRSPELRELAAIALG